MKGLLESTNGSVRAIVAQVLRGCGPEIIGAVGKLECLYKILRNYRNQYINPLPYMFPEMELSTNLSETFRGELFYQYGPGNFRNIFENNDLCVFYSQSLVHKLQQNNFWCVDGTFLVVPFPFV